MPRKVSKDGDLQAAGGRPGDRPGRRPPRTRGQQPGRGSEGAPPLQVPGRRPGYRLTSRDFSINTRFFTLDLSWRRVEMHHPPAPLEAAPDPRRAPAPPPDFEEVLRRLKLYALLETPPLPNRSEGAKVSPIRLPSDPCKITN